MNFYKHHIGDYAAATAHLSIVEDGAYCRLIRLYYRDEGPLPADLKAVQRLAAARSRDEREAVQTVLEEFFELREDGWHQSRCDEELDRWRQQAEANRRVAEEREAKRRARIANAQPTNRAKPKDESSHESLNESSASREPNQNPESRIQYSVGKSTPASSPLPARDDSPSGVGDPPSVQAAIAANPALPAVVALRKRGGVWLRLTPTNPEILTAIREGVTLETIEALADAYPEKPPTYVIRAARRERADGAQPITGETHHARPREPRKSLADQTLEWAAEQQGHGVPLDPDDREVRAPVDLAVRRTSGGSGGG